MKTTILTDDQILNALCDSLEATSIAICVEQPEAAWRMQDLADRWRDHPHEAAIPVMQARAFAVALQEADPITDARWRERRDELLAAANRYQDEAREARLAIAMWRNIVSAILNRLGITGARPNSENLILAESAVASQIEQIERNYERETTALRQVISDTATALDALIDPGATLEFMRHLPEEARLKVQRLKEMVVENDQRFGRIGAALLSALCAYTTGEEDKAIALLARRMRTAEELLENLGGRKVAGGWQFSLTPPATETPKRAVDWYAVKDMTPRQIGELIREARVMIRTDCGVWRAFGAGHATGQNDPSAGIYTGLDAFQHVCDLGPEKEAHLGIVRPVERVSA